MRIRLPWSGGRQLTLGLRMVAAVTPKIVKTAGIQNTCEDGMRVPFFDYDHKDIAAIQQEVRLLQETYDLGTAYLFDSGRGIHVVCLTKVLLWECQEMLKGASVDPAYRRRTRWVLRFAIRGRTGPPAFIGELPRRSMTRMSSMAHARFFATMYGIGIGDTAWDGSHKVTVVKYDTHDKAIARSIHAT